MSQIALDIFSKLKAKLGQESLENVYELTEPTHDNVEAVSPVICALRRGRHIGTSSNVWIKSYNIANYDPALIHQEMSILATLSHSNIAVLKHDFQDVEWTHLVFDSFDSRSLRSQMEMRPLSALEVRKIFKGLYAAMLHCHDNQILIRCVLPDSVMVRVGMGELRQDEVHIKSSVEVKLCDLGYATELSHMEDNLWVNHPLNNLSLEPYISPELAWGDEYLFQTDIWTLGVLLHLMATNQLPFQREDCADKGFLSIKAQNADYLTEFVDEWSRVDDESLEILVRACLQFDRLNRIKASDIRRSSWFASSS